VALTVSGIHQTLSTSADDILVISFYSSTIFTDVGYSPTDALYASLGYGAVQVVFTIPTLFLIDTKGRRTLCLIVSQCPFIEKYRF
jgi:hypothetical protein